MKRAFIVRSAKWGDEGKGHIVEALAEKYEANLIVRDVGGAQAAHHVVLKDGTWHRFQQFGSATFQNCPTLLSQHFVVDPFELQREAAELQQKGVADPYDLMYIHVGALLALPMHKYGDDQWRKANPGISTCGMGIGEARWLSAEHGLCVTVGDVGGDYCYGLLRDIQNFYAVVGFDVREMLEAMREILEKCHVIGGAQWEFMRDFSNIIIFEGAQGALLDATRGDIPYVTSSNTSYENAEEMLEGYTGQITRIAVMRSYETRHGAGPFVEESSEMLARLPELHNKDNEFQGEWRVGAFSMDATKRGLAILKNTDCIALTHLDRVALSCPKLEGELGIPVSICSWGTTKEDVEIYL